MLLHRQINLRTQELILLNNTKCFCCRRRIEQKYLVNGKITGKVERLKSERF